jgi:hypothetical protein
MTSPRKPTAGFWITVALVALLAYPISFGPACWISSRVQPSGRIVSMIYRPIILAWWEAPAPVDHFLTSFVLFGARHWCRLDERDGISFVLFEPPRLGLVNRFEQVFGVLRERLHRTNQNH